MQALLGSWQYSEYYLALLTAQQQSLIYHALRQAIHALRAEVDNIRQAWRWGAGHLSAPLVDYFAQSTPDTNGKREDQPVILNIDHQLFLSGPTPIYYKP